MQITNPVFNAIRYNAPSPKDLKSNVPQPQFGKTPLHYTHKFTKGRGVWKDYFLQKIKNLKEVILRNPDNEKKYNIYIKTPGYNSIQINSILNSANFRANGWEGFTMEHVVYLSSQLGKQSERKYVKSILNEKNLWQRRQDPILLPRGKCCLRSQNQYWKSPGCSSAAEHRQAYR